MTHVIVKFLCLVYRKELQMCWDIRPRLKSYYMSQLTQPDLINEIVKEIGLYLVKDTRNVRGL